MQAFTQGAVTIQVEVANLWPQVGEMSGYNCEFMWWLEIDGVEYVSGETAWHEDWHTGSADGGEGWGLDSVVDRLDGVDFDTHGDLDAVVDRVLRWFGSIREEIVEAWINVVNEYVERANEYGDYLPTVMQDV